MPALLNFRSQGKQHHDSGPCTISYQGDNSCLGLYNESTQYIDEGMQDHFGWSSFFRKHNINNENIAVSADMVHNIRLPRGIRPLWVVLPSMTSDLDSASCESSLLPIAASLFYVKA